MHRAVLLQVPVRQMCKFEGFPDSKKHYTAAHNTQRQDLTPLESYHGSNFFMFPCDHHKVEVSRRAKVGPNTAFL